jgi:hypothetical protein
MNDSILLLLTSFGGYNEEFSVKYTDDCYIVVSATYECDAMFLFVRIIHIDFDITM